MPRIFRRGLFRRLRKPAQLQGVLSVSEFERSFLTESARVERHGRSFSLVVYAIERAAIDVQTRIAEILVARARLTDTVGFVDSAHLGVLLPETDGQGAWAFADDTLVSLGQAGERVEVEVYGYPGPDAGSDSEGGAQQPTRIARPHHGRQADGPPPTTRRASVASRTAVPRESGLPIARVEPLQLVGGRSRTAGQAVATLGRAQTTRARRSAAGAGEARQFRLDGSAAIASLEIAAPEITSLAELERAPRKRPFVPPVARRGLGAVRDDERHRPVGALGEWLEVPLPAWKRAFDLAVCAVLLPVLAPVLA